MAVTTQPDIEELLQRTKAAQADTLRLLEQQRRGQLHLAADPAVQQQAASVSGSGSGSASRRRRQQQRQPDHLIADMWRDFAVDDYYPRHEALGDDDASEDDDEVAQARRRQRLQRRNEARTPWQWPQPPTVPQPFQLTPLRGPTQAMHDYAQQQLLREQQQLDECKTQIRAQPAPPATWQPRFAAMQDRELARRQRHAATRRQLAATARENLIAQARRRQQEQAALVAQPPTFKARPAPRHILQSDAYHQLLETDAYRQARREVIARSKLQQARAPGEMERRLQAVALGWDSRLKRMVTQADRRPGANSGRPPPTGSDRAAAQVQQEDEPQRDRRKKTEPRPFQLTAPTPAKVKVARVLEDMRQEEEHGKEQRWPFQAPRKPPTLPTGLTPDTKAYLALGKAAAVANRERSGTTATTRAARLRQAHVLKTLEQKEEAELREEEAQRQRTEKERQLALSVNKKSHLPQVSAEEREVAARLRVKNLQLQQEQLEKRYREKVYDIEERLATRSSLFERWQKEPPRSRGQSHLPANRHAAATARALGRYHRYTEDEFASIIDDLQDAEYAERQAGLVGAEEDSYLHELLSLTDEASAHGSVLDTSSTSSIAGWPQEGDHTGVNHTDTDYYAAADYEDRHSEGDSAPRHYHRKGATAASAVQADSSDSEAEAWPRMRAPDRRTVTWAASPQSGLDSGLSTPIVSPDASALLAEDSAEAWPRGSPLSNWRSSQQAKQRTTTTTGFDSGLSTPADSANTTVDSGDAKADEARQLLDISLTFEDDDVDEEEE